MRRNIHSLTPCLCGYYTTSLINFLHFVLSTASSLHSCGVWRSFSMTSLQVFFGLPLALTPSTSKSVHFFPKSFSSFLKTCPYHLNLCCCITVIISSVPSLSQFTTWEPVCYFNATHPRDHFHLSSLKCQLHCVPKKVDHQTHGGNFVKS